LKLKYDEPLSSFAFIFNLRRYTGVDTLEDMNKKIDQMAMDGRMDPALVRPVRNRSKRPSTHLPTLVS
jgi:hypothetical protein